MNYRHVFHAGNFADVVKHATLARIIVHLREKEQAFRVLDTHAGAGLYDLTSEEAERTGEWREGIGRLIDARLAADVTALLEPYLSVVTELNCGHDLRCYPGSPLLALGLMRRQDRLTACELEPAAIGALTTNLRRDRRAKAVLLDGWTALRAFLPPRERRGVVVVDPPYEDKDEFNRVAAAVIAAHRKWATGIYLLWYPIKERNGPDHLARELRRSGIGKILRVELSPTPAGNSPRLSGTGLVIINPPWRLATELASVVAALADLFRRGAPSSATVNWITGESRPVDV